MQPNSQEPTRPEQQETPPPTPTPPPASPSGGLTLQPLSSEEDILREAATHTPLTPAPPASRASTTEFSAEGASTDPGHPTTPPVIIPPLPNQVSRVAPVKRKSPWLKRIFMTVLLLTLAGGAVAAWAFFTLSSYTVKEGDLVTEEVDATTYLRPKQWKAQDQSFGDGRGKNGASSSIMMVRVSPAEPGLANAPPEVRELVRQQAESSLSDEKLREMMSDGDNPCTSIPNIQRTSDLVSTPEMDGLLRISASCDRKDGEYMFKMHVYFGAADGRIRIIGLGASSALWDTNAEVYDKILGSMKVAG